MPDYHTRLTSADVEYPLSRKLEDWEDIVSNALDKITTEEVTRAANPAGGEFVRALGLLNGGKDLVTTFLSGTPAAAVVVAPEFAVPLSILNKVTSALRSAQQTRTSVLTQKYSVVKDSLMDQVRLSEDTFPNSSTGRQIAQNIERAASGLYFRDVNARNAWCARFLENLGAIQLDQSAVEKQIREGFRPIFEKLGQIIKASLSSDTGVALRWIGVDPNWKWSGFNLHVPGAHRRNGGVGPAWPGTGPRAGLRHATSDEIKQILSNIWQYQITSRNVLVGSHGVAGGVSIVEVRPNPAAPRLPQAPDVKPAVTEMFSIKNVQAALERSRRDVSSGVVSIGGAVPHKSGQEPPEAFREYGATLRWF